MTWSAICVGLSLVGVATGSCNLLVENCNTVANKMPVPTATVAEGSVEVGLSDEDKTTFEHVLGNALRTTAPVVWATKEFFKRMDIFIHAAAAHTGANPDDSIMDMFGTGGSPHNTGYVGPSLPLIKQVLNNGSLREQWALGYIMTKTYGFDAIVAPIALEANSTSNPGLLTSIGLSAPDVLQRFQEIADTNMLSPDVKYSQGIPDYAFPHFDSWARFDFDGPPGLWLGCRQFKADGCGETTKMSNDPSLVPALSSAELEYQCGTESSCKLQWYPGLLCYDVLDHRFSDAIPGYVSRADSLEYRFVAGPSGTTANMLQLGVLLGFSTAELSLLRLSMAAWMLPTDDHSLFEILLGADNFMAEGFRMVQGQKDIGQFMPATVHITTGADAGKSFAPDTVWAPVGKDLMAAPVFARLDPAASSYLQSLFA